MDKLEPLGGQPRVTEAPSPGAHDSLFHELVERANDLFVVVGRDGRVQFVNQSFCHLTGYAREEVQNERLVFLLDPKTRQSAQKRLAQALQFNGRTAVDLSLLSKFGGTVEISFRPTAERAPDGTVERMTLVGQSPLLYGELAEQFNSLNRDLKAYSSQLEKLNAELEDRIEERTARLAALLEVSASLNTELQLDALFELVLRQATATIPGAEAGALLLYDHEADRLVVQAACGYHDYAIIHDLQAEMERVHPQAVFSDRQVRVWSGESRAKSGQMKVLLRKTDQFRIRSAISAPIATPSERLGVILLHNFDEPNAFTEDDVQLAESLAGSAAVAIINARLYEETRQQTERLELVSQLSAAVRDSVDLEQFLHLAAAGLARALGASRAVVTLLDEAAETPLYAAHYDEPGVKSFEGRPTFLAGTPLLREALGFREPRAVLEARYDPRIEEARAAVEEFGVESLVVAPLVVRDRFIGVLELHQCDRPRRWRPAEVGLLESVSKQVAVAVHQNRLYAKLRDTAREAERSQALLGQLSETAHDVIALLDPAFRISWHNRAMSRVTGRSRAELEGLALADLLGPGRREEARGKLEAAAGGEPQVFEAELLSPDGVPRDVLLTAAPAYEQGAPSGVLLVGKEL
jgi:PAS domain S-box-containing protein